MKIKYKNHLLQSAIKFSFAALTASAAITFAVSPNLVQGANDGYTDGYTTDDGSTDDGTTTPVANEPQTVEEIAIVEKQEQEQEAVADAILRKTVTTAVNTTTNHIKILSARKREFSIANASSYAKYNPTGLNAGSAVSGMAGWLTIPYSKFEDSSFTDNSSNFDGTSINYLAGLDLVLNTQLAVGASLGYEDSEIKFNNTSRTDTRGWFGTIYAAYNFPELTAYAIGGIGRGENTPSSAGSYDSDSHFMTGGAMKDFELDTNVSLNLDVSYTYAESDSDTYISNNLIVSPKGTILSQININAEIANVMQWGEVYGFAGSKFDLHDDDDAKHDNGNYSMDLGLGVRFNANQALTGDISVKKMFARKDEENMTITAGLRYKY